MYNRSRALRTGAFLACAIIALSGCLPEELEQLFQPTGRVRSSPSVSSFEVTPPEVARYLETEPNDVFDEANVVPPGAGVHLIGKIGADSDSYDLDVYDLGPAYAGDRVLAALNTNSGDGVEIGIFDDQFRLLAFADPASWANGPFTIDILLYEPTANLHAVVATRSNASFDRDYAADVQLQYGFDLPDPDPQILVLNFNGGDDVGIGNRPAVDVPPFDAAVIHPGFAGYTLDIIDLVLEKVRADFQGLSVEVYLADDVTIPDGERSVVYFGTSDSRLLGLADGVDPYNADPSQSAIIYTDMLTLFNRLSPTVEQLSQVLANVTSHEAGHLLGLRHTADPSGIMDITATARQLMNDQWFTTSRLHSSVMGIGIQDAPSLLAWTVGGTPPAPPKDRLARRQRAIEVANDPDDFYIPRHMLMSCTCPEHQ